MPTLQMAISSPRHATLAQFDRRTEHIKSVFANPRNVVGDDRIELRSMVKNLLITTPMRMYSVGKSTIVMKDETAHLTETHYDRCFVERLLEMEEAGDIQPSRTPLYEVSTGSAGVSFGAIGGTLLGYPTKIFIPPLDPVRTHLMRATIDEVDDQNEPGTFLPETVARFQEFLDKHKVSKETLPNHSRKQSTPRAFEAIAREVIDDLSARGIELDAFVCAIGNGTSITGIMNGLRERYPNIIAHGFEDASGGSAYYKVRGQPVPPIGNVTLYGAGGVGNVEMRMVNNLIADGTLTDQNTHLVSESQWQPEFEAYNLAHPQRTDTIGRTSAAALHIAKQLIDENDKPLNILTIIYDKADRYGNVLVSREDDEYIGDGQWKYGKALS